MENAVKVPQNLQSRTTSWSRNSITKYTTSKGMSRVYQETPTPSAAWLNTTKTWRQPQGQWGDKDDVLIDRMEYYASIK